MIKRTVSSGSPLEEPIGFSKAMRIDNLIAVAGTAPVRSGGHDQGCDACSVCEQTRFCRQIVAQAIQEAGLGLRCTWTGDGFPDPFDIFPISALFLEQHVLG
jgi:hypothetical protein